MKNLANCTPREFFAQSVKIKRSVEEWLDVTNLMDLRKTKPANLIKLDGLGIKKLDVLLFPFCIIFHPFIKIKI